MRIRSKSTNLPAIPLVRADRVAYDGMRMGGLVSRDPIRVGNLLTAAYPKLAERLLEARIRREWRQLVGPEIARRCQPGELRDGTLELTVDNSPWLQELGLRAAELLSRLSRRYGADAVRSLRLSLGTPRVEPVESNGHPRHRRGSGGSSEARPTAKAITAEETRNIEAAVALIPDPELRVSARRLLEKAWVAARERTGTP